MMSSSHIFNEYWISVDIFHHGKMMVFMVEMSNKVDIVLNKFILVCMMFSMFSMFSMFWIFCISYMMFWIFCISYMFDMMEHLFTS